MAGTLANALNFAKKSTQQISLDNIIPDPNQPRKSFSEESINELALSIKELGLISPISVQKHPESEFKYFIVAGERRYRAYKQLRDTAESEDERQKWSRIEAKVLEDEEVVIRAKQLAENVIREDLNPVERAEGLKAVYDLLKKENPKLVWSEVEKRVGISEVTRKRLMQILDAPETIKEAIREEKINQKEFLKFNKLSETSKKRYIKQLKENKPLTVKGREKKKTSNDLKNDLDRVIKNYLKEIEPKDIVQVLNELAKSIK